MSDGQLITTVNRILVGAVRDEAELAQFGWPQGRTAALREAMGNFAAIPSDAELTAMGAELTERHRALLRQAVEHVMAQVMVRVKSVFGPHSHTVRRFRTEHVHHTTGIPFRLLLLRVERQAATLMPQLAAAGLEQAHLDALHQYAEAYLGLLLGIDSGKDDRDRALHDRVDAGNAIYRELRKLCDLGRSLWRMKDASRYNDYLICPTGKPAKAAGARRKAGKAAG